jgi:hypothetical protein
VEVVETLSEVTAVLPEVAILVEAAEGQGPIRESAMRCPELQPRPRGGPTCEKERKERKKKETLVVYQNK